MCRMAYQARYPLTAREKVIKILFLKRCFIFIGHSFCFYDVLRHTSC